MDIAQRIVLRLNFMGVSFSLYLKSFELNLKFAES